MNPQPTAPRTRIKVCGLTRAQDVQAAVTAGVDAIGFVLYAKSPRAVSPERAAELAHLLPPFVTPVLLFVNPEPGDVAAACALLPTALLQLHGDESPQTCATLATAGQRPFLRAARIPTGPAGADFDLVKYALDYSQAQAILLDAHVEGSPCYGRAVNRWPWTSVPQWKSMRLGAEPSRASKTPKKLISLSPPCAPPTNALQD